jgi:hypothetical protein
MSHARRRLELMRLLAGMSCLVACDRTPAGDRMLPRLPPPPQPPASVVLVPVVVDGRVAAPIDDDLLASTPPRFEDSGRRLWRVADLIATGHGTRVEIRGRLGLGLTGAVGDRLSPYLMINRRGELSGVLVDEADPFPRYHGTGQRRQRPGDPAPRINAVSLIVVGR